MAASRKTSRKRPHGPPGTTKPVRRRKYPKLVQAWVTEELGARIQKYADAEQISVGAYVRRLLNNGVPGGV